MQLQHVQPDEINTGDRFRKEFGSLDDLSKSILDKGIVQPITVNEKMLLLAGERRLQAFIIAAEKHPKNRYIARGVPIIIRKTTGELDEREIELIENIHRRDMHWFERAALVERIHKLMVKKKGKKHTKADTAKLLGLDRSTISKEIELAEVATVVPDLKRAATADQARKTVKKLLEDEVVKETLEEVKKAQPEQKGAVGWAEAAYQVGDARKFCEKIKPGTWHFAEVDPPYSIGITDLKDEGTAGINEYNEIEPDKYPQFISRIAKAVYKGLETDTWGVWWYGPTWYDMVRDTLKSTGFLVDEIPCIWYKGDAGVSHNPDLILARSYEPFFLIRKGQPTLRKRGRSNVFHYKPVPAKRKIHPTERPVELVEELLDTFVYPGARILCPFLGSGNTIFASYNKGMSMITGWDLSSEMKKRFMSRAIMRFERSGKQQMEEENAT